MLQKKEDSKNRFIMVAIFGAVILGFYLVL